MITLEPSLAGHVKHASLPRDVSAFPSIVVNREHHHVDHRFQSFRLTKSTRA